MKEKWMVVSVTTKEALIGCLDQKCRVFCIENPLYKQFKDQILQMKELEDYQIEEHPDAQFMIAKRTCHDRKFDETRFELFYYPLNGKSGEM